MKRLCALYAVTRAGYYAWRQRGPSARHHQDAAMLEQIRAIYADLGQQVAKGNLSAPVEMVYPIEDIKEAVSHAQRGERSGKILVAPNGPV